MKRQHPPTRCSLSCNKIGHRHSGMGDMQCFGTCTPLLEAAAFNSNKRSYVFGTCSKIATKRGKYQIHKKQVKFYYTSDGAVCLWVTQEVLKTAFKTIVSGLMMPNGCGRVRVNFSATSCIYVGAYASRILHISSLPLVLDDSASLTFNRTC